MADSSAEANVAQSGDIKKAKKATTKKPAAKPTHPPTSEMVNKAIEHLKERGGSSLLAIKKYLASNYKVDANKLAPFIKKYVKSAVTSGKLIQTKGKGASGSFKLPATSKGKNVEPKKPSVKAKSVEKKVKVKKDKAVATEKKPKAASASVKKVTEKKKSATVAAKAAKKSGTVKAKSPKQKITKPSKAGVKPAKVPKPKKIPAATKKVAAKKATKK